MPAPPDDQAHVKRLLARTPVIQNACNLDLLVFLHRHPRTLLTTDQLAGFIGYDLKNIARSLESFIEAGLLERTAQQSLHAARLFVLLLEGPQAGGLKVLLELVSTREGRRRILDALKAPTPPNQTGSHLGLRLIDFPRVATG